MRKFVFFYIIMAFLFNCEEEKGKELPLGDEFEDIWVKIGDGYVHSLCASNLKEGEFFISSYDKIKRIENEKIKDVLFNTGYLQVTSLSSSFHYPERLIFGVRDTYFDSSTVIILNCESLDTQSIIIPHISYLSFVSFSSQNPHIFFAGDNHLILRSRDMGISFDTVFISTDSIIEFKAFKDRRIFISTTNEVFLSEDEGNTWSLIFSSQGIKGFTIDGEGDLYILFKDKIIRIYQGEQEIIFLPCSLGCKYGFMGAEKGVFLGILNEDVKVFKMVEDTRFIELPFNLLYTVELDCYEFSSFLFARNGKEYILVLNGYDYTWFGGYENGNIFYLYDSPLPP